MSLFKRPAFNEVVLDTDIELRRLKEEYELILERELQIARKNRRAKRKSKANYSKIGICYYSLYLIDETQWRLQEISTNKDLNDAMGALDKVFRAVNGLERRSGEINVKGLMRDINRMDEHRDNREENLAETLETLEENVKSAGVDIDDLVENNVISQLIAEEISLEECLEEQMGIQKDMDSLNEDISREFFKEDLPKETSFTKESDVKEQDEKTIKNFSGKLY